MSLEGSYAPEPTYAERFQHPTAAPNPFVSLLRLAGWSWTSLHFACWYQVWFRISKAHLFRHWGR